MDCSSGAAARGRGLRVGATALSCPPGPELSLLRNPARLGDTETMPGLPVGSLFTEGSYYGPRCFRAASLQMLAFRHPDTWKVRLLA